MNTAELKSRALYKEYLFEKVEERGAIVPIIVLAVVIIFTLTDYLALGLDSINFRLLAIVPLLCAIAAYLFKAPPKILMGLQQAWLIGGNLMMAGLSFVVFTEYQEIIILKYGTIIGYSIAIYISILISYDQSILWIIIIPLMMVSIGLYFSIELLEWVLMLNLYVVVGVSFILVNTQHKQEYGLFQQKQVMQELNSKLEQFGHIASHDMMSPLGTISTHLGIIERRLAAGEIEKAYKLFPNIRNSVQHMADLLDGILAYSSEPNVKEIHDWVDVSNTLTQVQENIAELIEDSGSNLVIGRNIPEIKGSATRMYQIFHNVILNAVKYRDPNRMQNILVESFREKQEYIIAVHDSGLGIPEHMQERVFAPFERYHIDIPGSGLGLSMIKKHIELHGGSVSLDSTEGVGSSFFLHFPLEICRKPVVHS